MKGFVLALVTLVLLFWGAAAKSQDVQRIAAVVNDQVISIYDLAARTRLILVSSDLQDTPEIRSRLAPQILRQLIDETLQLQEAKRLNVAVGSNEVQQALARIAKQNDMTEPQFQDFLKKADIPLSTVVDQVKAGIAWSKIVGQKIRPQIEIGDDQVQEYLARLQANENKPQYRLQEIFLAVDSPQQDEEVRRTAERFAEQIQGGANFLALARQFSQSATAAVGGDMGWVEQGSLDPELEKVVATLKTGEVSQPVRTVSGYTLLLLRERRQSGDEMPTEGDIKLEHIFLPRPANATPEDLEALRSTAQTVAETATSCADMPALRKQLPDARSVLPGSMAVKDLAPALRSVILKLPVGKASEPITINDGVLVVMVCERSAAAGLPDADEVRNRLGREKLDLLARRYMRDLRTAAFVDVRA